MPHATAIITGEQRDAIYDLLVGRLTFLSDLLTAVEQEDLETANRLVREFTEDFRLLADLGWEPDQRSEVPLTIPAANLTAVLERLRAEAESGLSESAEERDSREAEEASRRSWRLVVGTASELLASCGLRISEALALQRLHLQLDGPEPEVCIRRALVRERIEPPKSRHGRREVRLSAAVAASLRDHLAAQPDQDSTALAFPSEAGGPLDPGNLRRRVLKPLAARAGAPWAGFHTFRHTFSLHLSQGTNLLQLSRALGHHSPAFTLTRYTHLLPGDEAPALDLAAS